MEVLIKINTGILTLALLAYLALIGTAYELEILRMIFWNSDLLAKSWAHEEVNLYVFLNYYFISFFRFAHDMLLFKTHSHVAKLANTQAGVI